MGLGKLDPVGLSTNTWPMATLPLAITRIFLGSLFLGSLLASCGTTETKGYCELPSDCLQDENCEGNLCTPKPQSDASPQADASPQFDAGPPPATAATPTLSVEAIKTFRFTWTDVADATHYKLLESPDGTAEFEQAGDDIATGAQSLDHIVPLYARINAKYILQTCNGGGCIDSEEVAVSGNLASAIGYVKASNTGAGDRFGSAVALSADGLTMAVGAIEKAYVFVYDGTIWTEQSLLTANNGEAGDKFGESVALSADGNTLVVGAREEDGNDSGSLDRSGAVYVFTRTGTSWSQQQYLRATFPDNGDRFGDSVGLSDDGATLVVGASYDDSDSSANPNNSSSNNSGAAYVFSFNGAVWSEQAFLKASNLEPSDRFGITIAISGDGNTLAVGAYAEDSSGAQGDNGANGAGAAYVFVRNGASWGQQAYVKASNASAGSSFGYAIGLNENGNTLVVGAHRSGDTGAAYVFGRSGTSWNQEAFLNASNPSVDDIFGRQVALSADGNHLVVGGLWEDSNASGVAGDQNNSGALDAGAVYTFARSGSSWSQQAYVKASNTGAGDWFGHAVVLSSDGSTLAVGASYEDSNGGAQSNNAATDSGAVYIY